MLRVLRSDGRSYDPRDLRRLLDEIDWRIVGITALFAALADLEWMEELTGAHWRNAARALGDTELVGFLVLITAALLLRWPSNVMSRPVALATAVVVGSFAGQAITLAPHVGEFGASFPGGEPSYWTLVWFFARKSMMVWGILATAWYSLQRSADRLAALRASELARRVQETQLVEARLQVMQAQVEPHFLFNTLAHVKRLYKTNPLLARRMLDAFCRYLHSALPQMRSARTTLGTELTLAEAYLDVQKIRMGDRLVVEIAVGPKEREQPFPSMMLACLIENAIKHGLNPLPEGGTIRISAESSAEALRLTVADSGRGFSASRGTGVGLANVRGRLAALYGASGRFTLIANAPRGIRAMIEVPAAPIVGSERTG